MMVNCIDCGKKLACLTSIRCIGCNTKNSWSKQEYRDRRLASIRNPENQIKQSIALKNGWKSEERRRNARLYKLGQVEKDGWIQRGKYEVQYLDMISKMLGFIIDREGYIAAYKPDGIIHELKLCIEIDEPAHYTPKGLKADKIRDNNVRKEGYEIIHISDRFLRRGGLFWQNAEDKRIKETADIVSQENKLAERKKELGILG